VPAVASPDYQRLLARLSAYNTGPMIMRVGVVAADRMQSAWPDAVLYALKAMHEATGAKFIFGVNFYSEKAEVTAAQVRRIQEVIPAAAISAFAVGNEPNMCGAGPGARGRGARGRGAGGRGVEGRGACGRGA
jgi:hypothetical protein